MVVGEGRRVGTSLIMQIPAFTDSSGLYVHVAVYLTPL